jgi:hypothetical protein
MRSIKKTIKVREVECVIYDRNAKSERIATFTVPEVNELPSMPDNCILIEHKVLSEKEVTYSMKPETFFEHATIEE